MTDLELRFALLYVALWPIGALFTLAVGGLWSLLVDELAEWFTTDREGWR